MYFERLTITNARAIKRLELKLEPEECAGWHVLLGENGSGKTTVVRALSLTLMGILNAHASRQDWSSWTSSNSGVMTVELSLRRHKEDELPLGSRGHRFPSNAGMTMNPSMSGPSFSSSGSLADNGEEAQQPRHWLPGGGWFSASFGPFRRFSGGDPEQAKLYRSYPRLAPHLSALGEEAALSESLRWLPELMIEGSAGVDEDRQASARRTLEAVRDFLNSADLLSHGCRIQEVTTEQVFVVDGNGTRVPIDEMSDGYRSVLCLTLELLRLMFDNFGPEAGLIAIEGGKVHLPGVVTIDEVDAHLHPAWQARIGEWFVERFPQTQFLVTTHSPIICRSASRGSIWLLPSPGTGEEPYRVTGADYDQLVDGNILDAFATDLFGKNVSRSKRSRAKLLRLAKLNRKRLSDALDPEEEDELKALQRTMVSDPSGAARSE